jgi:hypothetical protein
MDDRELTKRITDALVDVINEAIKRSPDIFGIEIQARAQKPENLDVWVSVERKGD